VAEACAAFNRSKSDGTRRASLVFVAKCSAELGLEAPPETTNATEGPHSDDASLLVTRAIGRLLRRSLMR